ncbi:MAG: hypothetical protein ACO2ZP_05150 [Bacteriovoracaceae bacterium]
MKYFFFLVLISCAQLNDKPSSEKIIVNFNKASSWDSGAPERAQWDDHVNHQFYDSFSYLEKKALRLVHQKKWALPRVRGPRFKSIIQNKKERTKFCQQVPKGGMLHVHPTGLVKRSFLKSLIQKHNIMVNPKDLLKLATDGPRKELRSNEVDFLQNLPAKKFLSYSDAEKQKLLDLMFFKLEQAPFSFVRFQSIFSMLRYFIPKTEKNEFQIIKSFLIHARKLGVTYVELTDVFDYPIDFTKLRNKTKRLTRETGVHLRWNVAFIRDNNKENNIKLRDQLLKAKKRDDIFPILGIDLVANEDASTALDHWNIYRPIIRKGILSATMHAGEMGNPNNVRDALLMGVDRVGHGVLAQKDHLILEAMALLKKSIEINLKSNLLLGVVPEIKKHPFLRFHRISIPITFSTDDEGIFETDMAQECLLALENSDITYNELKQIYFNSLHYSFARKELKRKLILALEKSYLEFEKKWRLKSN